MIKTKTTTTLVLDRDKNIINAYTSLHQDFDQNGRLVNETEFDASGQAERKTLYTFDEAGRLIEQTVFIGHDQLLERTDHFYDDQGHLIRTEATPADGEKSIKEYHYDPVENIEKAVLNSANGEIKGYEILWYGSENEVIAEVKTDTHNRTAYKRFATYDGAGRLVMEEIFGYDEVFEKRTVYRYAPGGLLTEITTQGPNRRPLRTETYVYNEDRRLVECVQVDHPQDQETSVRYRYDARGRQVAEETYEDGQLMRQNRSTYDTKGNVVEEEVVSMTNTAPHAIRKHVIEYW